MTRKAVENEKSFPTAFLMVKLRFDEVFDGLILIWMETDIGKVAEG